MDQALDDGVERHLPASLHHLAHLARENVQEHLRVFRDICSVTHDIFCPRLEREHPPRDELLEHALQLGCGLQEREPNTGELVLVDHEDLLGVEEPEIQRPHREWARIGHDPPTLGDGPDAFEALRLAPQHLGLVRLARGIGERGAQQERVREPSLGPKRFRRCSDVRSPECSARLLIGTVRHSCRCTIDGRKGTAFERSVAPANEDRPALEVRPDLAERYRQVRPFEEAEAALVQALLARPDRLSRTHEVTLRQALNLARLWILHVEGEDRVLGPPLGPFRDRVRPIADRLRSSSQLDLARLAREAESLGPVVAAAAQRLTSQGATRETLDREIGQKRLVLAVGGGGGSGYVHLGAFELIDALRVKPAALVGTSIGALLSAFKAAGLDPRSSLIQSVFFDLRFKDLFRPLSAETRYGVPGALRLHLRSGLERFFLDEDGRPRSIGDLELPFVSVVTGVRREAFEAVRPYEREFRRALRKGALARLLHIKDLSSDLAQLLRDLSRRPGAVEAIALGADDLTRDFDTVDAVGFSMALPGVLQYDVTRDDPRMHGLLSALLHREGIDALSDGGLVSNVPARVAWELVQSGRVGTRNAMVLGLDCFVPSYGRHILFLPLQRIAADNVRKDRQFAQLIIPYRQVPTPMNVLPRHRVVRQAERWGREELERHVPLILKLLEPLPSLWASRKSAFG